MWAEVELKGWYGSVDGVPREVARRRRRDEEHELRIVLGVGNKLLWTEMNWRGSKGVDGGGIWDGIAEIREHLTLGPLTLLSLSPRIRSLSPRIQSLSL